MILLLIQGLFSFVVAYYAIYVILELRMVLLSQQCERAKFSEIVSPDYPSLGASFLPRVSVLLPVYNESLVIERLIDAVCRLDYPDRQLEILVLDDSTDETTAIAAERVAYHAAKGMDIKLVRRQDRSGYKAGNLIHGIQSAKGEFLAIFDADFVPPTDFLLKTIPCFDDPAVGYLQTGIGYTNRDASFLTRFQAMEMGHQQFVTVGLNHEGMMASLSGSSCVWRRACVENIGGWNGETITEDVDLGYRAQLNRWKYVFLRDVVSLSELPESISALRIQRDRWARGLIHNALRHFKTMLGSEMSWVQRLHAVSMMCSALLLASFFVLILLSLPLALMSDDLGVFFQINCAVFLCVIAIWIFSNFIGAQKGAKLPATDPVWKRLWQMYAYVAMFLPLSLYYFVAGMQVLVGRQGAFNRTPKGGGTFQAEATPRINTVLLALEWVVLFYSAIAVFTSIHMKNYWLLPFCFTVCVGFSMVMHFSRIEKVAYEDSRRNL